MSGSLSRLPLELLALVFDQLPLCNLTSISLVCKTWQIAAFPYLYHTISLSDVDHLEVLEERLSVDDAPDSLSVPIHLRCLRLGGCIKNKDSHSFDTIIPKLTHLNCLYWELEFMPNNFRWFFACPELKLVHLLPKILDSNYGWMNRLDQLLQFTNLTHFSLHTSTLPISYGFEIHYNSYIEPLAALLRSSPNLESIVLNIKGARAPYSPTLILEPLGSKFVFLQLHTFHVLGDADPGWSEFISTPTHPLRAFLARHPTIQDFGIGCPLEDVSSDGMDPEELSRLLPSVKHLACPLFLCEVVVISKLATQLVSLAISDFSLAGADEEDTPFYPLFSLMTEDSLPNLRQLAIWDDFGVYYLTAEVFEEFFLAAKGLEELEFRVDVYDSDDFFRVLSGAKNLRRITLDKNEFCPRGISDDAWRSVMVTLAETCPLLETIAQYRGISWAVVRGGSDQPTIEKIERCSL
ncbi:unnamed protein product [Rhizoctonia solani]|uniref:F-box domain-containing protein n=1 Tax=Rhizoctonia solani TaxID=456999 RepID=A0A8H3DR14_9AGAM|nr:unnamed protein product [Rhizoctonia solani]CAE6537088.1 unnamed protein product [Rhizoctonia solani]